MSWVKKFFIITDRSAIFLKIIKTPNLAEPSKIIPIFIDAYDSKSTKGITGELSKSFTLLNKNSTDYIRQCWESEANIVIPEETWLQIWKNRSTFTNSYFW